MQLDVWSNTRRTCITTDRHARARQTACPVARQKLKSLANGWPAVAQRAMATAGLVHGQVCFCCSTHLQMQFLLVTFN